MTVLVDMHPTRGRVRFMRAGVHVVFAKQALPFVESARGRYAHRVREVTLHNLGGKAHIAVGCWCGMVLFISPRKHGRLVAEPEPGRPICATCEGRAIGSGQLGAREIAGREVMFQPSRAK